MTISATLTNNNSLFLNIFIKKANANSYGIAFQQILIRKHLQHTWEHNQDTIDTSLLCRAAMNASSYFRSEINLASSFVGSSGTSTWYVNQSRISKLLTVYSKGRASSNPGLQQGPTSSWRQSSQPFHEVKDHCSAGWAEDSMCLSLFLWLQLPLAFSDPQVLLYSRFE